MMTGLLLAIGAILAVTITLFPYLVYPLTLRLLPERPLRRRAQAAPSATLLFCAHNEEASIPAKIRNLEEIRRVWPAMKFRCFVDKSSDGTLPLLGAHPDLVTVHVAAERVGKASGMAQMAAACDTDVIIFTDANVLVDPRCVPRLLSYFSDPAVGGLCGTLHYTNPGASDAATTSSAYWRLEERIKAMEARSGSTMGADGSMFATRRHLYPAVPPHLLDDFLVSMAVVFHGLRLVSAPDVRAFETTAISSTDEFHRRRRIACRAYLSHLFIRPHVFAMPPVNIYKYLGHKLVRWYGFWFATAAAVLAILSAIVTFGAGAIPVIGAIGGLGAAAVYRWRPRAIRIGREIVAQLFATSLGVIDAWRGRTYRTWTPQPRTAVVVPADFGERGAAYAPRRDDARQAQRA